MEALEEFQAEMARRAEEAKRRGRRDAIASAGAFGLLVFALWPLRVWHVAAGIVGLYWAIVISERTALRLADELDLLERKIAARLGDRTGIVGKPPANRS